MDTDGLSPMERGPEEALEKAGIGFIRLAHPEADTMEKCRGIGEEYGARHCKNLFLANKHGTNFFLLLMDPDKPYRTSEVSRKLGSTRLSFGTPEQLYAVLGLGPGSVSVMGLVNECARKAYDEGRLHIAIDGALLSRERICVHPNTGEATLVLATKDLIRFLESGGFEYAEVSI